MRLIDRYLFRQLLGPALLAAAALAGVAVLSESLSALDVLANQHQGLLVFGRIVLLAMPQLLAMILPIAVLVSALVAMNRLHTENEIVTCFSGGLSRWQVACPAFQLAGAASLVCLIITLWIQPLCYRALRETLASVRADLVGTLIRPGAFTHPGPGVTVYAQSVDEGGVIHNLFIDHDNVSGRDNTVTAREGRLETRGRSPILLLRNGANQEFTKSGVLNFISFDEYALDLRSLVSFDRPIQYKLSDRYLHELFYPDLSGEWERANRNKMLAEGHSRLAAPLYNIAFMAMALAAVIGGAFNRFGYGSRMAAVAAAALFTRVLGFGVQAAAATAPAANVLQYLVPITATVLAVLILFGRRPYRRLVAVGAPA